MVAARWHSAKNAEKHGARAVRQLPYHGQISLIFVFLSELDCFLLLSVIYKLLAGTVRPGRDGGLPAGSEEWEGRLSQLSS